MMFGNRRLFAKGRLRKGALNKTESEYKSHLESLLRSGSITAFWSQSVKVKIADGSCWYMPDFMVMLPDGTLEMHEVKGSPRIFMDDAKVKTKAAATSYPFRVIVAYPRRKRDGGGWDLEEF